VAGIGYGPMAEFTAGGEPERLCFECHRDAAHGRRGVSLLPYQDDLPYRETAP
jgi:hypothetical protein